MRGTVRWCLGLGLALASPASAQTGPTREFTIQGPVDLARESATHDIAFRVDQSDRMTVPVRIDGQGPFRFLVDTGANRTVVSTSIAAALGLSSGPLAKLHSVSGASMVKTANVSRLELSRDRVRSVDVALLEAAHMEADGIVGVDSLRSEKVIFDFRKRLISIVPTRQRVRDEPGTIVVRGKLNQGHLIVTGASANRVPMMAVLDTGSEITLGNAALRSELEARRKIRPGERIAMKSVTGQILVGDAIRLQSVTLGAVELQDLVILFTGAPIFQHLGLEDKPALLLGMNALRAFDKVSIDFARKQLRMTVPDARQSQLGGERGDPATMKWSRRTTVR